MASLAAESAFLRNGTTTAAAASAAAALFSFNWKASQRKSHRSLHTHCVDDRNRASKQLGLFSLKKKIEDTVLRAETLAPMALELEEARRNKQEQQIRDYNLWDDTAKSNEILAKLATSAKVVDALKDLTFKAEEAKLITQLAEVDAINYGLFRQAYDASLDVSKLLDQYEMSKLLKGPYDMEGACLTIEAGGEGYPEVWVKQLLSMYTKWAKKLGYKGRVVEKHSSTNGGITSATIEFEFAFAYGYLSGETGVHYLTSSQNVSDLPTASSAGVDVFPLFLGKAHDLEIDNDNLVVALPSVLEEQHQTEPTVSIQHKLTGISAQSSGERSHFANKIKAINRLKGKLLILALEQGVSEVSNIKKDEIVNLWEKETRRYMSYPHKLVKDVKTGIQLPDLMSVLDGNLEPLIGAHINTRQ
ncbi:peptide chain release factor PrfB3, chloroplastic [Pyrus x bretschneideri]|uniref:peptide chain release factor PrfB3, chloroplastic n=1 Tax=Pyrus x bretschneideri TaxID=225117 RepID=UPI00202F64C5|nr:peptide chain release factor PrfB3, chloroplastic [Pyrus x bretschneideri]